MKSGWWIGGIVCLGLLGAVASVCVAEEILFVNDHAVPFGDRSIQREDDLLVPLVEFGREIGVELVEVRGGGSITLRWAETRRTISPGLLPQVDGLLYTPVRWLAELIGARVYALGTTVHVRTDIPACREFEATGDRVTVRFAGFVPHSVIREDDEMVHLRFHHCRLSIPPRHVAFGEGAFLEARIVSTTPGAVDLFLWLRAPAAVQLRRHEAPGSYAVSIGLGDRPFVESTQQIDERTILREADRFAGNVGVSSTILQIRPWRDRWTFVPEIPPSGLGRESPLAQIALATDALAAIGIERFLPGRDLLVIDGVPLSLGDERSDVFGVDLFGRWAQGESLATIRLRIHGETVAIDDVNRPLEYGDIVVYTPRYNGAIAQGVPGAFTAVKIRDERVVSVYRGSVVFPDPSATLVVASGDVGAILAGVSLGDRAALEVSYTPGSPSFRSAVSCGPILFENGITRASDSPEHHLTWSLVATDWWGGLLLGTIAANETIGIRRADVIAFLDSLETPIRDAVVVSTGASASLAYWDGAGYQSLSGTQSVPLGLCLVPVRR